MPEKLNDTWNSSTILQQVQQPSIAVPYHMYNTRCDEDYLHGANSCKRVHSNYKMWHTLFATKV